MTKTYKSKSGAVYAARKAYGQDARAGVHFNLRPTPAGGWTVEDMPAANEPARKAKARRKPAGQANKAAAEPRSFAREAKPAQTKTEMLVAMMRRPQGATSRQMEEAAGWEPHSVRGLVGMLKKRGMAVVSDKQPKAPTIYRIEKVRPVAEDAVGDVI